MKLSDFGLCKPVDVGALPPLAEEEDAASADGSPGLQGARSPPGAEPSPTGARLAAWQRNRRKLVCHPLAVEHSPIQPDFRKTDGAYLVNVIRAMIHVDGRTTVMFPALLCHSLFNGGFRAPLLRGRCGVPTVRACDLVPVCVCV